jgi:hypothetical protein
MLEKLGMWLFSQEERAPISYILAVFCIFCSVIVVFVMVHYYLVFRGVL